MANTKNARICTEIADTSLGLLGNGTSGGWQVDIDETTTGPDRWFLEIDGPSVYFSFEIPSLDTFERILQFLSARRSSDDRKTRRFTPSIDSLDIGNDKHTPVTLLRDDEFDDRFFVVVGSMGAPLVRYALSGVDLTSVVAALEQVREDLKAD